MTDYSHSKLGTFQQCKYQLQYIDKVKSEFESVETFLGGIVHEVLEKLYKDLKFQKVNSKEELLKLFEDIWNERWHDKVMIVKKDYSAENYKEMGKKFISDYYDHYKPFNDIKTIDLETQDKLSLSEGNNYHIRIDRLACDDEGNYYICDYKTNNSLKAQGELDEDRQLAMYSLWVKKKYPDAKSVKLVWYFLAFDKEMISERNDEQLGELKQETEELIKEVENCQEFPTQVSSLCNYCQYMSICPAWKHKFELEEKKFEFDDGAKLVDEYSKVYYDLREAKKKVEGLKQDLIDFAKQRKVDVVFGSETKCSVKPYDKVVYPEDKTMLIKTIKDKGLYEDLSSINYFKLNPKIIKKEIDEDIIELIDIEKAHKVSVSKRKDKNGFKKGN